MCKNLWIKKKKISSETVIQTNSTLILPLKWNIRNILKYKKYLEIIPESFKFELVFDIDAKWEKEYLDTKKSSTYCPTTILKKCECLFAAPHKLLQSSSNFHVNLQLNYNHQNLQKLMICPPRLHIIAKIFHID